MGRWVCTAAEVEQRFVQGQGPERSAIWSDWVSLTSALRTVVGHVPAAWLSGSFLTSKAIPGDVDSVFVIDTADFRRVLSSSPQDAQVLWLVANNRAKTDLGVQVDSFVLEWEPNAGTARMAPDYYEGRGYWDDLWSRVRDNDARLDAIPRRGFLEVILDGYR